MNHAVEAKKEPTLEGDVAPPASLEGARSEEGELPEGKVPALVAFDLSSTLLARGPSRFFAIALVLSLFLHAGPFVYLQWDRADDIGPGGIQLKAINVDLIPLSEWRSGAPNIAPDTGKDAIDQDQKDQAEAAPRDVTETPPPEGFIKPTQEGGSELAAAETMKADPVMERVEKPEKDKPEKSEEPDTSNDARGRAKQTQEAADAQVRGGSSVAATPGQISRYALAIQQTLNRNPPRHLGTRGRAVIRFGLTENGSVRFAEIERSSGSKLIDDVVLAAIWKITFPAPPGGMSERQRSYTAPVEFR